MTINVILAILMVVAQIADIWTTFKILGQGGRETNRIVKWCLDRFGKMGLVLPKFGIILLTAACLNWAGESQLFTVFLTMLNFKYMTVIRDNWKEIIW